MKRLLIFYARVGDLVLLTPLMRALAAQGPLELAARPWAVPLLGSQPWLSAIHPLAKPNRGGWKDALAGAPRRKMAELLGRRGFDEIVVFDTETPAIADWIATWRGATPQRAIAIKPYGRAHKVDAFRDGAIAAGIPAAAFPTVPTLDLDPTRVQAARQRVGALGTRVVAIQAGSSLTHRWWRKQVNVKGLGHGQWARLAGRLVADGDADAIVLMGSAPERREAQAIIRAAAPELRPRLHDWTGQVGLAELPAALKACRAVLSVDTGPGHIAAAVGTPLLAVFGPTRPEEYLPRGLGPIELLLGSAPCQFCHETRRFKTCRDNICLSKLDDATIHGAWARLRSRLG